MDPGTALLLALAGLLAGFIDSIVGGGGVITLPALLAAGVPPHLALGTNKVAGTAASSTAALQYARAGLLKPRLAWSAFPVAVLAAVLGAVTVLQVDERVVVGLVAVVMVALVGYVLLRPRFGVEDRFRGLTAGSLAATALLALGVGFYDGFLGPGTGNFLLFGLVAIHGFSFLDAAAHGRLLNFGSNVGALAFFALTDNVSWGLGLLLGAATMTGAYVGSRAGIKHGARWIRPLFVTVAAVLLVRLLWGLRGVAA